MEAFAARLGGRVIGGPAANQQLTTDLSPASSSGTITEARIYEQAGSQAATSTETDLSQSRNTTSSSRRSSDSTATYYTSSDPDPALSKWLELCIRSGPRTFNLGELDVAGEQTDCSVFNKIRQKYDLERLPARIFGRFALRIPSGAEFVQVRSTLTDED